MLIIPNDKIYDAADEKTLVALSANPRIYENSGSYYNEFKWKRREDESESIVRASMHGLDLIGMISVINEWYGKTTKNMYITSYVNQYHYKLENLLSMYATFIDDVFNMIDLIINQYNKEYMRISVTVGSKQEKVYDKYIERLGGRVVGTFHSSFYDTVGNLHDTKWYEISAKEYNRLKKE